MECSFLFGRVAVKIPIEITMLHGNKDRSSIPTAQFARRGPSDSRPQSGNLSVGERYGLWRTASAFRYDGNTANSLAIDRQACDTARFFQSRTTKPESAMGPASRRPQLFATPPLETTTPHASSPIASPSMPFLVSKPRSGPDADMQPQDASVIPKISSLEELEEE